MAIIHGSDGPGGPGALARPNSQLQDQSSAARAEPRPVMAARSRREAQTELHDGAEDAVGEYQQRRQREVAHARARSTPFTGIALREHPACRARSGAWLTHNAAWPARRPTRAPLGSASRAAHPRPARWSPRPASSTVGDSRQGAIAAPGAGPRHPIVFAAAAHRRSRPSGNGTRIAARARCTRRARADSRRSWPAHVAREPHGGLVQVQHPAPPLVRRRSSSRDTALEASPMPASSGVEVGQRAQQQRLAGTRRLPAGRPARPARLSSEIDPANHGRRVSAAGLEQHGARLA